MIILILKHHKALIGIGSTLLVIILVIALWPKSQPSSPGGEAQTQTVKDDPPLTKQETLPSGYVEIPAGTFMMGSPSSEEGRYSNETQHGVTITRSFFLKETEVTQGEWRALMGNNPSRFSSCGDNCPVEKVNWYDALAYCNALSKTEGLTPCYDLSGCMGTPGKEGHTCPDNLHFDLSCKGYRLPTEAEWEYAYRAGTTSAFYNGGITKLVGKDPNLEKIDWYKENSESKTHPVKSKQANPWGLYDMSGNVWEWCWDWKVDYPSGSQRDPKGPSSVASNRVLRGGSWSSFARRARAAYRNSVGPSYRSNDLGFRPARSNH